MLETSRKRALSETVQHAANRASYVGMVLLDRSLRCGTSLMKVESVAANARGNEKGNLGGRILAFYSEIWGLTMAR